MTGTTQLETQLLGIGQVVAASRHVVPVYQRSYAWRERHILDLFDDLATAIQDDEADYFLGSIVLTKADTESPDVVDGQQRLATTLMLISAIRDYLFNNNQPVKAREIGRTYLATHDLRTDDVLSRLRLNSADNEFFERTVICPPDERVAMSASLESHRRIERAAILARERVNVIVRAAGKRAVDTLVDWIDFIHQKAKVIRVSVPSHANAFTIFETLNDRGLALAISDLLKNYVFSRADDRLTEVQANWTAMGGALESVGGDEIVVDYIRHLWSSLHGRVREKQLYKDIRKVVSSRAKAVAFSSDLQENAKLYCAILNPGHPFWRPYGDVARGYVAAINTLQVAEVQPLLLAVVRKFTTNQVVKALRLIVSCLVRAIVVSGRGGLRESGYSSIARQISQGSISTEKKLRLELAAIIPGDKEFIEAFSTATSSNGPRVRFILREMERYLNAEEAEWIPSDSVDDVNLEHILPRNLNSAWSHFDDEHHQAFVRRLGNMAILAASANSELGDVGFSKKKSVYQASTFQLTSWVSKCAAWTAAEISERQILLAEVAAKTWPLSGDHRSVPSKAIQARLSRQAAASAMRRPPKKKK